MFLSLLSSSSSIIIINSFRTFTDDKGEIRSPSRHVHALPKRNLYVREHKLKVILVGLEPQSDKFNIFHLGIFNSLCEVKLYHTMQPVHVNRNLVQQATLSLRSSAEVPLQSVVVVRHPAICFPSHFGSDSSVFCQFGFYLEQIFVLMCLFNQVFLLITFHSLLPDLKKVKSVICFMSSLMFLSLASCKFRFLWVSYRIFDL